MINPVNIATSFEKPSEINETAHVPSNTPKLPILGAGKIPEICEKVEPNIIISKIKFKFIVLNSI